MKFKFINAAAVGLILFVSNIANAGLIQWDQISDGDYFSIKSGASIIKATDDYATLQIPVLWSSTSGAFTNIFGNTGGYDVDQIDLTTPNTWTLTSIWDFTNGVSEFENLTITWLPTVTNHTSTLVSFAGKATLSNSVNSINLTATGQVENKIAQSGAVYGQFDATFYVNNINNVTPPVNSVPEPSTLAIWLLGMSGLASRRLKQ